MKNIFIISLLILVGSYCNAQEKIAYSKVIPVDGYSKSDIFVSIKEWFALNFVSAQNVIEMEDKEAGIIIGNTWIPYQYKGFAYSCFTGKLKYTIKIQIRDSKFKVTITNFDHQADPLCSVGILTVEETYTAKKTNNKYHNTVWLDLKKKTKNKADEMFAKLAKIEFEKFDNNSDNWN